MCNRAELCVMQQTCPSLGQCRECTKVNSHDYFYNDELLMVYPDIAKDGVDKLVTNAVIVAAGLIYSDIFGIVKT